MTICLGTRVTSVASNKNSSSTATNKGVILVEVADGHDQAVNIQLSVGSSAYRCNISISDLPSIFEEDETDANARILRLGRLFLRESSHDNEKQNTSGNRSNNLMNTFQYETGINSGCDSNDYNDGIVLVLQEKVVNEMKRTIYQTKMEKVDNISYCVAVGDMLNRSLREIEKLKNGIQLWKKTVEDLNRVQQESKDTLFANFTKLRNGLNDKHQTELRELKEAKDKEKETRVTESAAPVTASTSNKMTQSRNEIDLMDPINDGKKNLWRGRCLSFSGGSKIV